MPALHIDTPLRPAKTEAKPRVDRSRARRRSALLQLARRHGEVRVSVRERGAVVAHAPDVLELLDELNEVGRLSYGGMHHSTSSSAFVYRLAS